MLIDIDPNDGGVFMSHEQVSLTWTWVGEIDFTAAGDLNIEDDGDEPSGFENAEDAVEAAVSIVPVTLRDGLEIMLSTTIDVTEDSFHLLSALERVGFTVRLSLDPHGGGLTVIHGSGTSLTWWFITELDLEPEPEPELEDELDCTDLDAMMRHLHQTIDAAAGVMVAVQYDHPAAQEKKFFVINVFDEEDGEPYTFETLADAQRYVLEIAARDGVNGSPEDVLEWMATRSNVWWGRLHS